MTSLFSKSQAEKISQWRKTKQLHTVVEDRLTMLISKISSDYHPVKEPVGLAGGRNDLMVFEFSSKKVLFEIFATRSQVSRDLRILDKTKSDKKVAIIIDKEVDSSVFEMFVKENPEDNYPFMFIGELFEEPPILCTLKLRELILGDEEAKFQRMLRAKLPVKDFFRMCKEEGIEVLLQEDIKSGDITLAKMLTTVVLNKCLKFGIPREKVKNLGLWFSGNDITTYAMQRISMGMNVILYTDFVENLSVYADIDLKDWIRASYLFPQPFVIMSLNAVLLEIDEKYLPKDKRIFARKEPTVYLGSSQVYESSAGKLVICSLPKDTYSVIIIPPIGETKTAEEYGKLVQVTQPNLQVVVKLPPKGADTT
jgi:hypothetical protein